MQGVNGQAPGGAYIVGLDAETGKEAWRFYTIARPGEPGGDTWNGLPLEQRTGGSVWTAGSYDAERKLAFFGPAPTYDTGPLRDPVGRRGVTNEALYTNSTIALDPDTGKVAWYFQHVPNDQWDFDWAFERQLIDLPVNGRERKVLVTSGKEAIYDALDVEDGALSLLDRPWDCRTSSRRSIRARARRKSIRARPFAREAHHRMPACGRREELGSGVDQSADEAALRAARRILHGPDARAAGPARLAFDRRALDHPAAPRQRRPLRPAFRRSISTLARRCGRERQRAPQTTGVLATAGGLVFAGALDRVFTAYDDATGKALWQREAHDVPSSAPISYAVNGKQYVAMTVGYGSAHALTFPMLTPEIDLPIVRSATIWVFALPSP